MNKQSETEQNEQVFAAVVEVLSHLGRSDQAVLFDLCVAYQYHGTPEGVYYGAPYLEMGEQIWRSIQSELHETLCTDGHPKPWVEEKISGAAQLAAVRQSYSLLQVDDQLVDPNKSMEND